MWSFQMMYMIPIRRALASVLPARSEARTRARKSAAVAGPACGWRRGSSRRRGPPRARRRWRSSGGRCRRRRRPGCGRSSGRAPWSRSWPSGSTSSRPGRGRSPRSPRRGPRGRRARRGRRRPRRRAGARGCGGGTWGLSGGRGSLEGRSGPPLLSALPDTGPSASAERLGEAAVLGRPAVVAEARRSACSRRTRRGRSPRAGRCPVSSTIARAPASPRVCSRCASIARARPRPRTRRGDVHPLDLGGVDGCRSLDVAPAAPGAGRDRLVVEVADEEAAGGRLEHQRVERRLVAAAVADDVLLLHGLDQQQRVRVAEATRGSGARRPRRPGPIRGAERRCHNRQR